MPNLPAAFAALARMAAAMGLTEYSIAEVTNAYRDHLKNFVYEAMNGRMDAVDLARVMRALLRDLGDDAYVEGMREGGIRQPEEALDDDDEAAIKAWLDGQLPHVREFSRAATAEGADRADILARVDYWVDNLGLLGKQGYASAKRNQMVTWRLGKTEKHCGSCLRLNGKRRRLKWFLKGGYIPQERGSESLDCGGWNCDCRLETDDGEQVMP